MSKFGVLMVTIFLAASSVSADEPVEEPVDPTDVEPAVPPAATEARPPPPPPVAPPVIPTAAACDAVYDGEIVCDGSGPRLEHPDSSYGLEAHASIDEQLRYVVTPANYECRRDWEQIEFELIGLPDGATAKVAVDDDLAEIRWRPGRDDIGEHFVTARVRARGHPWNEAELKIVVTEEWETFFMPGAQYSLLVPEARDQFGVLQGVSIEYLVAGWIHRNENRGPSHGRFYIDIDLMRSTVTSDLGIIYSMGMTLSFERNPKRQFLIPYFGVELGGIYQKPETGDQVHAAQVNPLGGISLFASQNLFVNVTAGYMVPFSHMEQLRGFRAKAGLNFSFW
jgi:hypothetical protein